MVKATTAFLNARAILENASITSPAFEADALFTHIVGNSRFMLDEISKACYDDLIVLAKRRAENQPLQYLLGQWGFLDLSLDVGPGVLIPRAETEELCLAAAEILSEIGDKNPCILDLCSGSGAIALGLQSLFPCANIAALELYDEAIFYLKKNLLNFAKTHKKSPTIVKDNIFSYHSQLEPQSLDMIISNPPYVGTEEYNGLAPELFWEPKSALLAGENGLAFYHTIAKNYRFALKPQGFLAVEIGASQGEAVCTILRQNSWKSTVLRQDFAGLDRIIIAKP